MTTAMLTGVASAATSRTNKFQQAMSTVSGTVTDTSESDRANKIQQQRAMYESVGNQTTSTQNISGAAKCDNDLRKCMAGKCGEDFTKCKNDSSTIWGDKISSCRRQTQCTAHEYELLAPEILADRDANVSMSYYNAVINCGNKYNNCIFTACGTGLNKCLGKSDGDQAISKCASIARDCREQDNGLAARAMSAFGDLRKIATNRVSRDEARLYELRNLMRDTCTRLGAIFDERTLDCVYTVNFFAGEDATTPMASKKLYAGDTFQCNADWFGIDVTTFKENAYRRTRAQTSASSAMLGSGLGTAVGLWASEAPIRAIKSQNAEQAMKQSKNCMDSLQINDKSHVSSAEYDENGNCIVKCQNGYRRNNNNECEQNEETVDSINTIINDGVQTGIKATSDVTKTVVAAVSAYITKDPTVIGAVAQTAGATSSAAWKAKDNLSDEELAQITDLLNKNQNVQSYEGIDENNVDYFISKDRLKAIAQIIKQKDTRYDNIDRQNLNLQDILPTDALNNITNIIQN